MATYKYAGWTFGRVEALLNIIGERNAEALLQGWLTPRFELVRLELDCSSTLDGAEYPGMPREIDEQDGRALTLTKVDFARVSYETCLKEGERGIVGEEKLRRLKAMDAVRLGGNQFKALWQDYVAKRDGSVLEHLYRAFGLRYLDFFGLILRCHGGPRHVLCLFRAGREWRRGCNSLDADSNRHNPAHHCGCSVVLTAGGSLVQAT